MPARIASALLPLARPVSEYSQDPENARVHDEPSLAAIRASLEAYGQQRPIVALRSGRVVAGNGTLAAVIALGWDKVAAVRFESEELARAYALADNRTAELSIWDEDAVRAAREERGASPTDASMLWDEVLVGLGEGDDLPPAAGAHAAGGSPTGWQERATPEEEAASKVERVRFEVLLTDEEMALVKSKLELAVREVESSSGVDLSTPCRRNGAALDVIARWYLRTAGAKPA